MRRSLILTVAVVLLVPSSSLADLPFFDDFNRPDGIWIGNGWGSWGGNVDLRTGRLYAGNSGIIRDDLRFPFDTPMTFDFDFDVMGDNPGGWMIQINTTNPETANLDNQPRLIALIQHEGEGGIRLKVGDNLSDSWQYSEFARPWVSGQGVHVNGVVFPDLSIQVTVDHLDGGPQAIYEFASSGIDPTTIEQGILFALGDPNLGGAFFDNLLVTPEPSTLMLLAAGGVLLLHRRQKS